MVATCMREGERTQNDALLEAWEITLVDSYELPRFSLRASLRIMHPLIKKAPSQKTAQLLCKILTLFDA